MIFYDSATKIALADPAIDPLAHAGTTVTDIIKARKNYILSSSGWRNIFAKDNDSESLTAEISLEDSFLSGLMAYTFAAYLQKQKDIPYKRLSILVATDSRPTGPAIADMIMRILLSLQVSTTFTFITATPEALAYSVLSSDIDGFIYISASHNPVGYNGTKFGANGKVLESAAAAELIDSFISYSSDSSIIERIRTLSSQTPISVYEQVLASLPQKKAEALESYRIFTGSVASGSLCICGQDQIYNTIRDYAEMNGIGIVCDFNGSARTRSIDHDMLSSLGITTTVINDKPGVFAHRIVPEGSSLDQCRKALEDAYAEDPSYIFGYVPDCDGDRGNIVYMDENSAKAKILEAQELFALVVLAELAYVTSRSKGLERFAVAINGPTSMRIDTIAHFFGAEVYRTEVGEANVVQLAERLRKKGYTVRVLGEGSNGGNITHPASVRDPLNTIFSLLKLITLRGDANQQGLYQSWCTHSKQSSHYSPNFTLSDIIQTLPHYQTTSAYEDRAIMKIAIDDHEQLKRRYEKLFAAYWKEHRKEFTDLKICSYQEFNTTGSKEIKGSGKSARPASSTGGLRIVFYDTDKTPTDFIWMRGSKTEPVFRVLADCAGPDPTREERLLTIHKKIIQQAVK